MRPGVVCGLDEERACLDVLPEAVRPAVRCLGVGASRAEAAARELIAAGCGGLISFGLAGGLDPGLLPGSLVVPEEVVSDAGGCTAIDAAWRERLLGRLAADRVPVAGGRLYGSNRVVLTVDDKRSLAIRTEAAAIDMESHAVGRVARDAKRPFLVVRVVLDPANESVPRWLPDVVNERGKPRIAAVALGCLTNVRDLPCLLRLARGQRAGLASLRRVALHAGPLFALG